MNTRRSFLGSLLAVAAAPLINKEAAGNWFTRLFKKKTLVAKPLIDLGYPMKLHPIPIEWYGIGIGQQREMREKVLQKMKEDVDRITQEMIRKFNEDAMKPNTWITRKADPDAFLNLPEYKSFRFGRE